MDGRERPALFQLKSVSRDLLAGGAAAAIRTTLETPWDLVQVTMRLHNSEMTRSIFDTTWKPYTGMGNCFARVAREQVALHLFRRVCPLRSAIRGRSLFLSLMAFVSAL